MEQQLDRRRLMGMLALGLAGLLASCSAAWATSAQDQDAAVAPAPAAAPVPPLPPVPPPRPGPSQVVHHGPTAGRRIALTVDDGTSAEVVAGYVALAQRVGVHLTFSPNGAYNREWAPHAAVLRPLVAAGQVQIINHTFTHRDLRTLAPAAIRDELVRNDDWVIGTFGTTTRPYYRPPYGRHSPAIDDIAAGLGYTRTVLWNGSFSDSEVVTPQFLLSQAQKYLQPGVINSDTRTIPRCWVCSTRSWTSSTVATWRPSRSMRCSPPAAPPAPPEPAAGPAAPPSGCRSCRP